MCTNFNHFVTHCSLRLETKTFDFQSETRQGPIDDPTFHRESETDDETERRWENASRDRLDLDLDLNSNR